MDTLPPVPLDLPAPVAAKIPDAHRSPWESIADAVLSTDPRRRIRLTQWLISALVYSASALVMWFGTRQGWVHGERLLGWCVFLIAGLSAVYLALRSGWSERFADPALTAAQIVLGVLAVAWGYLICGPVRHVALLPLLLIFTFGAFSLSWRGLTALTVFALASLFGCVVALHVVTPGGPTWSLSNAELRVDLTNVMMVTIMLPALSLVAARLSSLRNKLRSQRAALTEALQEVQRLATRDELTGLANRRHMLDRLAQEHARSARMGHVFCIAVIDLDHFKWVNDAYGHAGGDDMLRAFVTAATATLRASDLMARWGGDEFLLLLPETQGPQAYASVQRLLTQVRTLQHANGQPLSFSAGVTEHRPGESVTETVARADQEMYEAKRAGRNAVMLQ